MDKIYNEYLSKSMFYYYTEEDFIKCYDYIPRQRDYTFNYCINYFENKEFINILELGTSRSFVDGRFPGSCNPSLNLWEPNCLDKWDWSSGLFTRYFSDILQERNKKFKITTVDIDPKSISISKVITNNNKNIEYVISSSEEFISKCEKGTIDLLYLDTGNMDEATAQLHLREAKLLIINDILKQDGIILIDDVKNPYMLLNKITTNKLGKSKYALPYLLENGYEIIEDEYQVILKKNKN